jgi:DNA sulfur modification protein DndC
MRFCSNCLIPQTEKDLATIKRIQREYLKDTNPWFIGYSGGKDSSALLSLVINALAGLQTFPRKVTVVFCDTGVENPVLTRYVYSTFASLKHECDLLKIPVVFEIVKPNLNDRFFVKVIGKGYPTPTNIFRWCTKTLRINPVKRLINKDEKAVILLGVRIGESIERDRTIGKHRSSKNYYLKQEGSTNNLIFAPILNYSIKDVWSSIKFKSFPKSIDHDTIGKLYKDAGSECPVFQETKGTPCGKGRFGCWTCTVVRKDKSVQEMINNGHDELIPLFEFRNWISKFRDNKNYRCTVRRNGKTGLGPITLRGRKIILEKLTALERETGVKILDMGERSLIHKLWREDRNDPEYRERVKKSTAK